MTHPIADLALAGLVVVAIGAGTLAVLPRQPAPTTNIAIDPVAAPVQRSEPLSPQTDAERIEALQRQLTEVAAEQKRLADTLRTVARERRQH